MNDKDQDAARAIVEQVVVDIHPASVAEWLVKEIAAALRAERERAAKIAETHGVYPELNIYNGGPDWYKHGRAIARAIRQQAQEAGDDQR